MKKYVASVFTAVLGGILTLGGYKLFLEKKEIHSIENSNQQPQLVSTNFSKTAATFEFSENSFVEAANKTVNSVVHVKNVSTSKGPMSLLDLMYGGSGKQTQIGTGSGVIITPDGYIVTNNHVIANSTSLEVTLNNNKSYPAKLIGTDVSSDIALLKIDTEEQLPFLTFADSDNTQIGEWVLAVGNPFNLNSTVTAGIISAKARNISQNISDKVESFIQTDAAVNQGNSGGALVNLKGDLIGINTAITSTTGSYVGYSFAVPSNIAKKVVEDLIEYGNVQKGVLGVRGTELNSESAEKLGIKQTEGFYVDSVEDDSGAANAGIQKGDVIKQIDNVRIHKFSDLTGYIASKRPGDVLKVLFERNAKEKTVNITLQKNATYIINSLGLEVKNLSDKDKSTFKTKKGVKITGASQFYEFHNVKMTGKVLLSVNGNTFKDVDELKNILSQLSSNQRNSLELLNEKGEKERFFF
ncbi:putative periplasmic serine protease do/hhoA-like protein [Capnocytophaga canimorsus]|uniref:Putative periplasmic serine protease do/hhoA-like protein n=1 Tax=Capnocytophaga canimorsus TaxID=28188 RepID=A0A0B7HM74_9FLAO|nr:trypsin-like peptidase domain-containing protein [Capnocytophaga canimorsus]ATA77831.1 serine protease [Capnocytophaga canimorsus]PJI79724.1 Do/DeqQ family serine protease [Capnocytophaga canimorsus]CEN39714.1 putative periplasmic serine protease do/hhoA-like protein [Capnocytophaga canimorsus]STA73123.1 Periplasmic serine endoprotease DegP precursor [Capnocytophaga canimorsus]